MLGKSERSSEWSAEANANTPTPIDVHEIM
jgi:hypothetical protein